MKRHEFLQPLSREHHFSLLLCWKIRRGFSKKVEIGRMKKYADWFYKSYIQPHFEMEEKFIFPILGKENELVKKALSEHRKLKRLFESNKDVERSLSLIEEELESHIRFEERILFEEIQQIASEEQSKAIIKLHAEEKFRENTQDEFWK